MELFLLRFGLFPSLACFAFQSKGERGRILGRTCMRTASIYAPRSSDDARYTEQRKLGLNLPTASRRAKRLSPRVLQRDAAGFFLATGPAIADDRNGVIFFHVRNTGPI